MFSTWSSLLSNTLTVASIAILLAAATHDIVARTVPNGLALALALLGCVAQTLRGTLPTGLAAGIAVFLLAAICWRRGWLGGGDVKLLGATAIVVPPHNVIDLIVAVSLAGAVLALIYLVARRITAAPPMQRPSHLPARALRVERWRIRRGGPLPYACAIAAGFLFVIL